uniref:Integrase, catalytic region, zinc finger, CCHC-type, peptidase aspartic, catalytic n=1 Tax=Tanacetum cinerariifolium TaxID=118510 RepID=A0A6L2KGW5_TANCI|nr:integrase, catalytic region, zinc finger, CCHC-type, peptidase aspartic, catalytic [Tanacetum cinerariifolium]
MQTQTSNTLHNAIMEAGGKDRPPMLAPGNYIQWKSRIKRYIDTKPNHELIHYCLKNPPYKFTWADKQVPIFEGRPVTRTEAYMETYKNVSQDIRDQLNAVAEAIQIILTGIDNDIYSIVDACHNACEMWKAIERSQKATRNKGKAIASSPQPIYDQEPSMVVKDDEMSKVKEIDKLMALISLSGAGYDNQRSGNVAGARETVGTTVVHKSRIQCYNCKGFRHVAKECQKPKWVKDAAYHREKMLLCKQEAAGIQLNAEQADWRDDTDDESKDQELEALYVHGTTSRELDKRNKVEYASKVEIDCAKARGGLVSYKMESQKSFNKYTQTINDLNQTISEMKEKLSAHQETISILSQQKEAQIKLYKTREDKELDKVIALENKVKVLDNIVYRTGQSVQTMSMLNSKCQTSFAKPEFLKKAQRANPRLYDIGCYNDNLALMLAPESDEVIHLEKESRSKLSDLIRHFDYEKLNILYALFVPQREKSSEQQYFLETSRLSHTPVNNGNSKESFNNKKTLVEKQMDESIPWDQKCKSSIELFKIKSSVGMIFDGLERCKETIANRTYFGHLDPFIQNTIEANFSHEIRRINDGLEQFHMCLNEEMVADLRYFNSLKFEDLKAQLPDKSIVISELKKLIEKLKGKSVDTKFEKSSVIRQPNAFKSQRPSILCKQTIFSDSLERKDFSKSNVNSRTIMPVVVPVSTREPKRTVKQSAAKPLKKTVASESNQKPRNITRKLYERVKIVLFIVDYRCSKHMTGNLKLLINFVEKFLGTVKFRNDQIAPILGYGDLVQGAVMIKRVYYVEGLNHNLFSVGQFCDADLEVAFQKSTCYIRDLKGNDLLTGSRGIELYSITLQDTNSPNPICLMAKATSSPAWLVQSGLHAQVRIVRIDKGTEFLNKTLHVYFASEGILHQTLVARTPEQNGVVERRNHTLVEATRTMLSAAKVLLFFWAKEIAASCFTQNRSLVIPQHEKTPYHIINDRKPSVKFFYIFGSLCYIVRDGENLNKIKEKGDACIFVGYSTQSRAYRVFNKRTRVIVETIHVNFDELPQMASDHVSFDPGPECQRTTLKHVCLSPGL